MSCRLEGGEAGEVDARLLAFGLSWGVDGVGARGSSVISSLESLGLGLSGSPSFGLKYEVMAAFLLGDMVAADPETLVMVWNLVASSTGTEVEALGLTPSISCGRRNLECEGRKGRVEVGWLIRVQARQGRPRGQIDAKSLYFTYECKLWPARREGWRRSDEPWLANMVAMTVHTKKDSNHTFELRCSLCGVFISISSAGIGRAGKAGRYQRPYSGNDAGMVFACHGSVWPITRHLT